MPAVEYPYAIVEGRRSPLIPLGIGAQGRWQRVEAYVDSGAFYSVFKPDFALILGLEWHHGERVSVQVGDGASFPSISTRWIYNFGSIVFLAVSCSLTV